MADIYMDSATIHEVAEDLKQAKTIIDLQCNTLNEVSEIIERSWQCKDTARLCQCLNHTRKRLQESGNSFAGIGNTLEWAMRKAKLADTLKTAGIGDGGGFR